MRILLVSVGNFKHCGERSHTFAQRIYNGLVRNNHHVYFMSDRDIAREGGLLGRLFAKKRVNQIFSKICDNFIPDMIIMGQADYISTETMLEIRKKYPHIKISLFCIDIILHPHIQQTIISKLIAVDSIFCTTAGESIKKYFKQSHLVVGYIPNPCDTSIDYIRAESHTDQPYDVFWAMRGYRNSWHGDPRFDIPRYLKNETSVNIDYYGFDDKPVLLGRNYYEAIRHCKGGLNISVSRLNEYENNTTQDIYLYSSDRIGHYFGCGLLVYIMRGFSLEELIPENTHAVYFSSALELRDKILFYQKNDNLRQKIASAGAIYYRQYFNGETVSDYMIDVTFNGKALKKYAWNTEIY